MKYTGLKEQHVIALLKEVITTLEAGKATVDEYDIRRDVIEVSKGVGFQWRDFEPGKSRHTVFLKYSLPAPQKENTTA